MMLVLMFATEEKCYINSNSIAFSLKSKAFDLSHQCFGKFRSLKEHKKILKTHKTLSVVRMLAQLL